jgi:formate-dependent nitrite reductase membrane component NrfD
MDFMSNQSQKYFEKRLGPDFLVYWIRISSFIVWLVLGVFFFVTDLAKPQQTTFFDRLFDVSRRTIWDQNLMMISFFVAVILFFFSLLSLIINTKRLKRKSDHISISLVISLIVSTLSILLYLAYALNNINALY